MISDKKKKSKTFTIMLVLALAVLFTFQMNPVWADTPYVTNIEYYTAGNDTFVEITVLHTSTDPVHHYINKAIFEINGTEYEVAVEPQEESQTVFSIEYNMGEVMENETYNVRARVFDTNHGYSAWSDTMVIPEFSTLPLLLIFAMVSTAVLLFKFNARMRRER